MARSPILLTCLSVLLLAADIEPRWRVLNHDARLAIDAKDYTKLRSTLLELQALLPGNPRIAYNLAASEAKLGNSAAALTILRNLAEMGLVYDLAADEDFAALKSSSQFAAIAKRMQANKRQVSHSTVAFPLAETDLIPEDLAYDPKTRRFFVSSVRKSKIITADGKEFAKADWSIFALAVDAERRILWATTGWVPQCELCIKSDDGKTALLAFDLDSGALKRRIESPVKGLLGDMTIGRKGDVYVSEGIHGAVFRLRAGAAELERLDLAGEFPSPQTPALSADEQTLYVPDYLRGIAAIDLNDPSVADASRSVTWLQPASNIATSGIDGLYVFGNSFLAVQNGTHPPRVMRFSLDLRRQEILETNTTGLGEPTHGTVVDGTFYFVANGGWNEYDAKGVKKPGSGPVRSAIWKIPLVKKVGDDGEQAPAP